MEVLNKTFKKVVRLLTPTTLKVLSCSNSGCASVTWNIPNFSDVPFEAEGRLRSSSFLCCDAEWAVGLLTKSEAKASNPQTMLLCLVRISSKVKVHSTTFRIGLKNEKGACERIYQYGTVCEINDPAWYPLISFLRQDILSRFTPNNAFTVFFDFKPFYSTENTEERFNVTSKEITPTKDSGINCLSSDLEILLGKTENCDVTIEVCDQKFTAHKLILGARSSYFAAMFEHDMLENRTNVVTIDDIQPLTFQDLLLYMYTGRVRNFTADKAVALYKASDMYDLKELKTKCVEILLKNITMENVCELAVVADIYNDGKIMDSVVHFAHKNASKFFASKEWNDLLGDDSNLSSKIMKSVTSQLASKR